MEDRIMFWSIIPLVGRMAFVHLVLRWGTNNAITTGLSAEDIHHREIGSKLVLAARIFYAALLVNLVALGRLFTDYRLQSLDRKTHHLRVPQTIV